MITPQTPLKSHHEAYSNRIDWPAGRQESRMGRLVESSPKKWYISIMGKDLNAFKIKVNGKILDYRVGNDLNLEDIKTFFSQNYQIEKIWPAPRHILGILKRDKSRVFLKLAKSEGIGAMTQIEYKWNEIFNKTYSHMSIFRVPKDLDSGFYHGLFYEIMELFEGQPLCNTHENPTRISDSIAKVIEFSELIQDISITGLERNDYIKAKDYIEWFVKKTKLWFDGIPQNIVQGYKINELLTLVEKASSILEKRTRHGDFTPWHIIKLNNGLGLTDGEHAISDGVENYDICYFIQRVHSELKGERVAKLIFKELFKRGYDKNKLKTVLATRAIGGFLDESLKPKPNYDFKNKFREWVLSI